MKKYLKSSLLLSSIILSLHADAKYVSENTAKQIGLNYLNSVGVRVNDISKLELTYTAQTKSGSKSLSEYYVFNLSDKPGFVIVSADDLVTPILGYSNTSYFNYDLSAPATKFWLDGYKNQIAYTIENNVKVNTATISRWKNLSEYKPIQNVAGKTTAVTPLLTTTWNQDPYYNGLCPIASGDQAVTGCVATAMAQIMKFWNWPKIGCGNHSYTHDVYGYQYANFGTTAYQWSSMPNAISGTNNAIATLMYHCGVSVNMQYGPASTGGSGAYTTNYQSPYINNAEYAFRSYFHYDDSLHSLARFGNYDGPLYNLDSFTTANWISTLKSELDAGRPMLYAGRGLEGGHAWVCDGWQVSGDMFHFNWGWGGMSDGYFTVDNLSPSSLGTGGGGGNFNEDQRVITGIKPDYYPSTTSGPIKMLSNMDFVNENPITYKQPFSFKVKLKNTGTTTFNGDVSARIYDASGNQVGTVATYADLTIEPGDSTPVLTYASLSGVEAMVCGRYDIRLYYKNTGSTTAQPVADNGSFFNNGSIDMNTDISLRLADSIQVTSSYPIYKYSPFSISTNLINFDMSSMLYVGPLKADLVHVTSGVVYNVSTIPSISIGLAITSATFSTPSLMVPAGDYALIIKYQSGFSTYGAVGSQYFKNPIRVSVLAPSDIPSTGNNEAIDALAYPNPASRDLNLMYDINKVKAIYITDILGRLVYSNSTLPQSGTIQLDVTNYASGIYSVTYATSSENITRKITVEK